MFLYESDLFVEYGISTLGGAALRQKGLWYSPPYG